MKTVLNLLWIIALVFVATPSEALTQEPLLLENLRIFDADTGIMTAPQDLLIEKGRIKAKGHVEEPAHKIDCTGKFAVPGLCDCHTHLAMLTMDEEKIMYEQLAAFSKNGVTHVRDVGGPVKILRQMRDRIASGEQIGPEIFYCGPMLEKSPLHWGEHNETMPEFTVAVDTKESVDRLLPLLAENGACMIKTFYKQDPEVYEHMVKKAAELSLRIVHDPGIPLMHPMPIHKALALGVTSFEHGMAPWPAVLNDELQEQLETLLTGDASKMERMSFMMQVLFMGSESVSMEKLQKLCEEMNKKQAYLCPTLQVFDAMEARRASEEEAGKEEDAETEMQKKAGAALKEIGRFFVTEFNKRGVKLLVGQDGPSPKGIFAETEQLKRCGITEAEIIKGATLYPARWLGVDDRLGTIRPGKEANLLIVDGNPLHDIKKLRDTFLVIQKGRVVFQKEEG